MRAADPAAWGPPSAFHNCIARYSCVAGREGLLPAAGGRTHGVFESPHVGSVVQTLCALGAVALFAGLGLDPVLSGLVMAALFVHVFLPPRVLCAPRFPYDRARRPCSTPQSCACLSAGTCINRRCPPWRHCFCNDSSPAD